MHERQGVGASTTFRGVADNENRALALQIPIHSSQTCKNTCTATAPQTTLPPVACPSAITESTTLPSETTIFSYVSSVSLSTTTITTCPSSAAPTQTTSSLPSPVNDCSSLTNPYKFRDSQTFQISCDTYSPTTIDMLEVYVYTFEDCIKGCMSYNDNTEVHPGSMCYAVSWQSSGRESSGGNCNFVYQNNITLVEADGYDAALLIDD